MNVGSEQLRFSIVDKKIGNMGLMVASILCVLDRVLYGKQVCRGFRRMDLINDPQKKIVDEVMYAPHICPAGIYALAGINREQCAINSKGDVSGRSPYLSNIKLI